MSAKLHRDLATTPCAHKTKKKKAIHSEKSRIATRKCSSSFVSTTVRQHLRTSNVFPYISTSALVSFAFILAGLANSKLTVCIRLHCVNGLDLTQRPKNHPDGRTGWRIQVVRERHFNWDHLWKERYHNPHPREICGDTRDHRTKSVTKM